MPYSTPAPAVHPVSVLVADPAIEVLDASNSTDCEDVAFVNATPPVM